MKNIKFGAFFLGLLTAVAGLVSGVSAQGVRVQAEPRLDRNVFMLDGRGAQLGVMVSDLEATAGTTGVKIDDVNPDSPAEKAGIRAGDVVVEYDGERVRSARQFTRLVQETPEGRQVAIALMRDGKRQTVNATPENARLTWDLRGDRDGLRGRLDSGELRDFLLRELPNFEFERRDGPPRRFEYRMPDRAFPMLPGTTRGRLGVTVQSLTRDLEEYFGATNGGALVSSVEDASPASNAGVKAGDVIVSVNGRRVSDSDELVRELQGIDGDVTIVLLRDKKEMTLKATLEAARSPRVVRPSRPGVI